MEGRTRGRSGHGGRGKRGKGGTLREEKGGRGWRGERRRKEGVLGQVGGRDEGALDAPPCASGGECS